MRIDVDEDFVKLLDKLRKDGKISRKKAAKELTKRINRNARIMGRKLK